MTIDILLRRSAHSAGGTVTACGYGKIGKENIKIVLTRKDNYSNIINVAKQIDLQQEMCV